MRRSAALSAWIDDAGAQAASRTRTVNAARECHGLPALVAFRRRLAAAGEDVPAIDAAVATLFADGGSAGGWIASLIEMLARHAAADPFFDPPFLPIDNGLHHGLVLHDDTRVVVAIGIGGLEPLAARKDGRRGAASITFSGYRTRLCFLRAGEATLAFYRLAGPPGDERCVFAGRRAIADGATLVVDGDRTGWVVERAGGDLLLLQATIRVGRSPIAREFDADSGRLIAVATNDEAASRMQLLISMLAASDAEEAVDAIAGCLADPHGFVRWHAMRELTALAPDAALPELTAMAADDPDQELRDAARATLAMLGAPCPA